MSRAIVTSGVIAGTAAIASLTTLAFSDQESIRREHRAENSVRILAPANHPDALSQASKELMLKGYVRAAGIEMHSTKEIPSDIWSSAEAITYGRIEYRADLTNEKPNLVILKPLHKGLPLSSHTTEVMFNLTLNDPKIANQEVWIAGSWHVASNGVFVAIGAELSH